MYKKTIPQQKLFGIDTQLSASLRNRIESSWAQLFKCEVLPILFKNEDQYAMLYGKTGRPNFSVARLLGELKSNVVYEKIRRRSEFPRYHQ